MTSGTSWGSWGIRSGGLLAACLRKYLRHVQLGGSPKQTQNMLKGLPILAASGGPRYYPTGTGGLGWGDGHADLLPFQPTPGSERNMDG